MGFVAVRCCLLLCGVLLDVLCVLCVACCWCWWLMFVNDVGCLLLFVARCLLCVGCCVLFGLVNVLLLLFVVAVIRWCCLMPDVAVRRVLFLVRCCWVSVTC